MGDTMAELGTCGTCGRPLGEGKAFCGGCGSEAPGPGGPEVNADAVPLPKDPTIRLGALPTMSDCGSCGARIEAGSPFCPACGAPPNGRSSVATMHVAPPAPRVSVAPQRAVGAGRSRRGRVLAAAAAAVLVVAAAFGVALWSGLGSGAGDDAPVTQSGAPAPSPSVIADSAIPPDGDIAALIVPAEQLTAPPTAEGRWERVGEFRRTFEAGKPYDRCSGATSPGDARRITHEFRFGSTPTFATEAVTVFADAGAATTFFDGEGQTSPGCPQGNGAEAPASIAGTEAAVISTSATTNVVRLRKGNVLVTITTDASVPWQPIADRAAARL